VLLVLSSTKRLGSVWDPPNSEYFIVIFGLHRTSTVSRTRFIIQTDAHNYKITGMLKVIKIPIIAPTCFSSRRNRHQGAISCLAKTTIMILVLAKHEIAPW
jgi:hypothetical protein